MLGKRLLDAGRQVEPGTAAQVERELQSADRWRVLMPGLGTRITAGLIRVVAHRAIGENRPAPDRLGEA
jgi:hypothetical protein